MNLLGPKLDAAAQCEAVLRTLPGWFGIEEALLTYARDSTLLPTFAIADDEAPIAGFIALEVFPELWSPRNPCLQMIKRLG